MRLGLTKREFYALTPVLFCALRKQWVEVEREQRVLFALVRRDLINYSMGRPKRLVTLQDLVPDLEGSIADPSPRKRMTKKRRDRVAATLREVFSNMPGVIFIPGE